MRNTPIILVIYLCLFIIATTNAHGNASNYLLNGADLEITGPLQISERHKLSGSSIRYVYLAGAADKGIFTKPKISKHLHQVVISQSAHWKQQLKGLAENFTSLRMLTISLPSEELTEDDVDNLARLRSLQMLELIGRVTNTEFFCTALPSPLKTLLLSKTNIAESPGRTLNLPKLTRFQLSHSSLGVKFVQNLQASRLEEIGLYYVAIDAGAIAELSKYRNLRELALYQSLTPATERELETLQRNLPRLKIIKIEKPKSRPK